MKEQLRLLEELQRHDARLQEYETTLKAIPEKLQVLKNDLAKMEALLAREQQGLAGTESFRRDQEQQIKADSENITKAKAKLQQVKSGKEHMAAQREVEANRKMVGDREEETLKLIDAIESTKKTIASHADDVSQLRAHVEKETAQASQTVDELRAKAAAEKTVRDEVAAKVKPDVLKRYGSIRLRRGLAVVPVVGGTCQGCHMIIPPQLYNMLQRGLAIESCPSCARIIYWAELMKDKELERGEEKQR